MTTAAPQPADEKALVARAKKVAKAHGFAMVKGRGQFSVSNHLLYMIARDRFLRRD